MSSLPQLRSMPQILVAALLCVPAMASAQTAYRVLNGDVRNREWCGLVLPDGANLGKRNLDRSVWRQCRMQGAQFAGTTITDAIFEECDLSEADFSEAALLGQTTFTRCRLQRANFRTRPIDAAVSFLECDMDSARFDGCRYSGFIAGGSAVGASFAGAVLDGARLSDVDLSAVDFERVSLRGAQLVRTRVDEARFTDANLSGASLIDLRLSQRLRLVGTELAGVRMGTTDLALLDFERVGWGQELWEEREGDKLAEFRTAWSRLDRERLYSRAEGVYRELAEIYGARGYAADRNRFWYRAMESRRKVLRLRPEGARVEAFLLQVRKELDGYSTKPGRIIRNAALVWVAFGMCYFVLLMRGSPRLRWVDAAEAEEVPDAEQRGRVRSQRTVALTNAFVFSANAMVLFTERVADMSAILRLLYWHSDGWNLAPRGWLRQVVAIEGVIGMVLVFAAVRTAVAVVTGH